MLKRTTKVSTTSGINFVYESINKELSQMSKSFSKQHPDNPDWLSARLLTIFSKQQDIENEEKQRVNTTFRNEIFCKLQESKAASVAELRSLLLPRCFVIEINDFDYDKSLLEHRPIMMSMAPEQQNNLSNVITLLLSVATTEDEVCVCLESPGGSVIHYGLVYAELKRLRKAGLRLTVLSEKVLASGGYLAAAAADRVICAPFALIGSIGVVTEMPNISKVLKKLEVDYDIYTSGEYKRTLHPLIEKTDKAVEKTKQDLFEIHQNFRDIVKSARGLNSEELQRVSLGETWLARESIEKELKLVDEISTKSEYFEAKVETHEVLRIRIGQEKESMLESFRKQYFSLESRIKSLFLEKSLPLAKL